MKCAGCHKPFDVNELDEESFCYECSNYDDRPAVTTDGAIAEAVKSALEGIAYRAGTKSKVDNGGGN